MSDNTHHSQTNICAKLDGRDEISLQTQMSPQLKASGCQKLLEKVQFYLTNQGNDPKKWTLPTENNHVDILLREFILKSQGNWNFPYAHEELCHCRSVQTHTVDQAVIAGAHSAKEVTRQTSAGSSCGTCQPDIEKIIQYRLLQK